MTTRLEIVNHMLGVTGQAHVSTLETTHPTVVQAIAALVSVDTDFQSPGWWFNRENDITLSENIDGEVIVPTAALEFTVTHPVLQAQTPANKARYVKRGTRLYDNYEHTYNIGQSIRADLIMQIAIEDLPGAAAVYLKHLAAETFYVDDDGDNQKADRLKMRRLEAWAQLKAAELRAIATNALDSPMAQQLNYRINQSGTSSNPMYPGGRFQ